MHHRDEFNDLLEVWAEYMKRPEPGHGYNGRASGGLRSLGALDTEQLYGQLDRQSVEKMTACVDSLRICFRAALFKSLGLADVWRFKSMAYDETLEEARLQLLELFKKRGLLSAEYCAKMRTDGTLHVRTIRKVAS